MVEKEGFRELMGGLVGKLIIKKRSFFTSKLQSEYSNTKTNLITALEKVKFVSTTANLWTSIRRSFIHSSLARK